MPLTVENLQHAYLGPISLSVAAGECVAMMGPSGAGKTLLLRAIADLDPCEGGVALNGSNWRGMSAPAWRRKVAYLPAEPGWWNERVAPHFADPDQAACLAARLLLPREIMDWRIARLSTGERQRLALIRCLVGAPEALLLDEPTAALDSAARDAVEALLREQLAAGKPILLVTHDPEQAERLANRRLTIAKGRLLPEGEAVND